MRQEECIGQDVDGIADRHLTPVAEVNLRPVGGRALHVFLQAQAGTERVLEERNCLGVVGSQKDDLVRPPFGLHDLVYGSDEIVEGGYPAVVLQLLDHDIGDPAMEADGKSPGRESGMDAAHPFPQLFIADSQPLLERQARAIA